MSWFTPMPGELYVFRPPVLSYWPLWTSPGDGFTMSDTVTLGTRVLVIGSFIAHIGQRQGSLDVYTYLLSLTSSGTLGWLELAAFSVPENWTKL